MNKKINLLLVENNPDHALLETKALVRLTSNLELNIMLLDNADDAIAYIRGAGRFSRREMPDLVIVDLKMPGKDGFDVLREVKSDERFKELPIIVLSSSDDESDIHAAYKMGSNSYVVKPIRYEAFAERVGQIPDYWGKVNELPPKQKKKQA